MRYARGIDTGNMATFNCPEEEVYSRLKNAEKLIALHPRADMAQFVLSGGADYVHQQHHLN